MSEFLRALMQRDATTPTDTGPIRFVASAEGVKRDGLELKVEDWDLENYRKNPVVLWAHDYGGFASPRPPIGRATVEVDTKARVLLADVVFDAGDPFAADIERKYRNGFLNAVSVGWDTYKSENNSTRNELLDVSAVPMPGDPDALMERQRRSLANLGEALTQLIDDEPDDLQGFDAQAVWEGTALRMARLFTTAADDGFDERVYRQLERQYRRLGKTAPEVPPRLDAMSVTEIRGLFLAGEPDLVPELFRAADPTSEAEWLAAFHAEFVGASQ